MNGNGNDMDLYRAAGELAGLTSLVDAFYANMDTFPEARVIRKMHPDDLTESRKKLTYFLCGVLGGPRLFIEHYGGVDLPERHQYTISSRAEFALEPVDIGLAFSVKLAPKF